MINRTIPISVHVSNKSAARQQYFRERLPISTLYTFAVASLITTIAITATHCGGAQETVKPITSQSAKPATEKAPKAPAEEMPADSRVLAAYATFGDVVTAANNLDQRLLSHSDKKCLLRRPALLQEPWNLDADLAVAVRPLPSTPDDLDKRLEGHPGKVHVMTLWGRVGDDTNAIVLVAFTTTSPQSARLPAVALFLTDRGITVRQSDEASEPNAAPLQLADVGPFLANLASKKEFALYVTANANISLRALYDLLSVLPYPQREVALTVALAPETRLPKPFIPSAKEADIWCPQGLPEPPEEAPQGDIPQIEIMTAMGSMRDKARQCLSVAEGSGAAGGRVVIAMRVDENGNVSKQCLVEDAIQDLALGKCLLSTVGELRFPPPSPKGFVDIHLPLKLSPEGISGQSPICK
jgi:hypothetical protein